MRPSEGPSSKSGHHLYGRPCVVARSSNDAGQVRAATQGRPCRWSQFWLTFILQARNLELETRNPEPGTFMNKQLTLGILLSGRGSNFAAIAENVMTGKLPCEIGCVIGNVATAPGLERAREWGLNSYFLDSRGKERAAFDTEVMEKLSAHNVDYVCLAGYMRLLSPSFVEAFPHRILNIHPSLLPAFPGLHAQRQALEHGVRYSGCTVHFVDAGLDTGPIILQTVVPVLQEDDEDSLSARILKEEHRLYSEAIRLLCEGRVQLEGRRVRIL